MPEVLVLFLYWYRFWPHDHPLCCSDCVCSTACSLSFSMLISLQSKCDAGKGTTQHSLKQTISPGQINWQNVLSLETVELWPVHRMYCWSDGVAAIDIRSLSHQLYTRSKFRPTHQPPKPSKPPLESKMQTNSNFDCSSWPAIFQILHHPLSPLTRPRMPQPNTSSRLSQKSATHQHTTSSTLFQHPTSAHL